MNRDMIKLNVNEIFYSIQGEGGRAGQPSIFIRLSGCNLNCSFCDTDWNKNTVMNINEILAIISKFKCNWIVWTGGEPTLQLTTEILEFFPEYKHAIETNGTKPVPEGIDYIVCSPKTVPYQVEWKLRFPNLIDELRYPLAVGQYLPKISDLPKSLKYYLSPIFINGKLNNDSVEYCVNKCLENPQWNLSIQVHKLINIP